jgi:hypothetical protein
VALTRAGGENSGHPSATSGKANDDGTCPNCPVRPAVTSPATSAGKDWRQTGAKETPAQEVCDQGASNHYGHSRSDDFTFVIYGAQAGEDVRNERHDGSCDQPVDDWSRDPGCERTGKAEYSDQGNDRAGQESRAGELRKAELIPDRSEEDDREHVAR